MSITPSAETASAYDLAPHLGVTVSYLSGHAQRTAHRTGRRTVWLITEGGGDDATAEAEVTVGIWQHASEAIEEAAALAADTGCNYRVTQTHLR